MLHEYSQVPLQRFWLFPGIAGQMLRQNCGDAVLLSLVVLHLQPFLNREKDGQWNSLPANKYALDFFGVKFQRYVIRGGGAFVALRSDQTLSPSKPHLINR